MKKAIFAITSTAYKDVNCYGVHGYEYEPTEKPVGLVKTRVHTTKGYLTRKQVAETEDCEFVNPLRFIDKHYTQFVADVDEDSRDLKVCLAFLKYVVELGVECVDIYHTFPYIERGIRNINNKRMLNKNGELWKAFYDIISANAFAWIHTSSINTKKPTTPLLGVAMLERAGEISATAYGNSVGAPFDVEKTYITEDPDTYWKHKVDLPDLLCFKELCYYTNVKPKENICYMVNRGNDYFNIGKKAGNCGYAIAMLNDKPQLVEDVKTIITPKVPVKPNLIGLRLDTVRINPGFVLSDILRYKEDVLYETTKDTNSGELVTIHEKKFVAYGDHPALTIQGLYYMKHLEAVLNLFRGKEDKLYSIESRYDITDQFVDSSGVKPIPTQFLKDMQGVVKVDIGKGKRLLQVDSEIPSKNALTKLVKKNLKLTFIRFKTERNGLSRAAVIVECDEGIAIFNNWHLSIFL